MGLKKTYRTTTRIWLQQVARGMDIGSEFWDHDRRMKIVSASKGRRRAGEKDDAVNFEAVEVPVQDDKKTANF
jgi:hypothetical protein